MDTGSPIFRADAVRQRRGPRDRGDVLRLAPRWTTGAFYALLALFVIALVVATVWKIDTYVTGVTAVDSEGRVVVLVPEATGGSVDVGDAVEIGTLEVEVGSVEVTSLEPAAALDRFGAVVGSRSIAVMTSARPIDAFAGTARISVGSTPLIVALVPGLGALLGRADA